MSKITFWRPARAVFALVLAAAFVVGGQHDDGVGRHGRVLLELLDQRPAQAGLFAEDDRLASGGFFDGARDAPGAQGVAAVDDKNRAVVRGRRCCTRGDPFFLRDPHAELAALRVRQDAGQVEARSLAARVEAEIEAPAAADAFPEPALELDAETHLEGVFAFDDGVVLVLVVEVDDVGVPARSQVPLGQLDLGSPIEPVRVVRPAGR
jgi:hypothetical protein